MVATARWRISNDAQCEFYTGILPLFAAQQVAGYLHHSILTGTLVTGRRLTIS